MKLKSKLLLSCLALSTVFVATSIATATAPAHQMEVAQRGMI
ncbi:PhrC/PhrF family phosphatase-inhibitory pheromone [Bacillus mojavensis]|nr:PhrC/PhrF family phosphatase-inhibitory pheromone [Bacillus mojavensis]MEC1291741.1 PhrC/PhrF family phosphatase-inhibitory pheromone [Bacillus mojavensis]MEC1703411.1 PhrC/PhrF family phosphatase-inhibitory pheromone [Bacillus mojavensis]MEC5246853.1 PhrC/PhrF family phosphatase-inhibitory pheromone [Bacillus mojavensis]